jgi:acyl dehydratase
MFENMIGKRSEKVINAVERGAVKKFAEAIGDPHPIYVDREYGAKTHYQNNIAPPTFPRVFDYGTIEALKLPAAGLIHGEQVFEYERPLVVGEEVHCYSEVGNYFEKAGGSGKMGFLIINNNGEDASGKEIFRSKSVIIITEAVRKGIENAANLRA